MSLIKWKPVPVAEFAEFYSVSNIGRIRREPRETNGRNGKRIKLKARVHTVNVDPNGYAICLLSVNGIRKSFAVHRLVALAFIPNPGELPTVDHENRIRHDNRVENLKWSDYSGQAKNRGGKFEQNGQGLLWAG